MPCRVDPTPSEIERSELNGQAERLHEWLKTKLEGYDPKLDETGYLCKEINALGEEEF